MRLFEACVGVEKEQPLGVGRTASDIHLRAATRGRLHHIGAVRPRDRGGFVVGATVDDDDVGRDILLFLQVAEQARERTGLVERRDDDRQAQCI